MLHMKPMMRPRPHPDMTEETEAFERFQQSLKAVLKVPKSALPSSSFSRPKAQNGTLRKGEGSAKLI